jgi:ribose 5-phosphate isomerase A
VSWTRARGTPAAAAFSDDEPDPGADLGVTSDGVTTAACGDQGALERLALRALTHVRDGALVGLGSGRAASAFVRALGAQVGRGLRVRGVPTSESAARLAREVGVPLAGLDEGVLDLTVDGADEVDPRLDLIKGYGGALVRERIVAAASRRLIILVGEEKLVPVLGSRGRLPVEVIPFGCPLVVRELAALGCRPALRLSGSGPFVSDNGNWIIDCGVRPIEAPAAFLFDLLRIPGVVDTGLVLGRADLVLVAEACGIVERWRGGSGA